MFITTVYVNGTLFLDGEYAGPGWFAEVRDCQGKISHVTRIVADEPRARALARHWVDTCVDLAACC